MKSAVFFLLLLNFSKFNFAQKEELCNEVKEIERSLNDLEQNDHHLIDRSLNELEQDDPKLIEEVKTRLIPPTPRTTPYNFTK